MLSVMTGSPWQDTTVAAMWPSAWHWTLDHPAAVSHLAVIDGVPIGEALARCDARFATEWWHWFFMGNPAAQAERVINADPDAWYHT